MSDLPHDAPPAAFPTVLWGEAEATFQAAFPPEGERIAAVVVFAAVGDRWLVADIPGRGWCVPSGRLEPGESAEEAALRETREEVGADLEGLTYLGYYGLREAGGSKVVPAYCGVVAGEWGDLPLGTESRGARLLSRDELPAHYWLWDPLIEAVFSLAEQAISGLMRRQP
jgi:8-oxo-dGTP diphosphatase